MSLFGIMRTSTSGMAAQANMLGTIADNIANSSTTGYKRAAEEFSTLVLESGVADYASGSVKANTRTYNDQQGGFAYTSSASDLAIQGDGFFVVRNADGKTSLTRAGAFTQTGDGKLVNTAGYQLMAYAASGGTTPVSNGLAGLVPVDIKSLGLIAQPSTKGALSVNLPPDGTMVSSSTLPSLNSATSKFTAKTSLVVYDNVGGAKILDVYESRTGIDTWEFTVFDRSQAASNGGFPYASGPLATTALSFNPVSGALASGSATSLAIPVPNGKSLTIDLSGSTELSAPYSVKSATIDGSAPSTVDRIEISEDGSLSAVYKSGARVLAYQIPLATVSSPNNLNGKSDNLFTATDNSGDITIGLPQVGSLGHVVSGALEKSTVDVATELTAMIEAQHSYTANSKVFQTAADLMDVLINLKR